MPKLTILSFCLFLACFSMLRLSGQEKSISPVLYSITEQNGLSDNAVTCFFQDSRGFIWIGTIDGLNRYDGSVIRIFKTPDTENDEQENNRVNAIAEDSLHHIWVGTNNGLNMYDPLTDSFYTWKINKKENEESDQIKSLLIDQAGHIWLGSGNGLHLFDPVQKTFRTYDIIEGKNKQATHSADFVVNMLIDKQKRFWLGTFAGLWQFFPSDGHFEQYLSAKDLGPGEELVTNLFEDHQGQIWIGVWNQGINLFNPQTRKIVRTFYNPTGNTTSIAETKDAKGNYHLYFTPQLNELDLQTGTMTQYLTSHKAGQDNINISNLYVSRDNLLWLATNEGIRIMDPARQVFHHHFLSDHAISTQGISVIQSGKKIYVGGRGNHFLVQYDSSFQQEKNLLPGFTLTESGKKTDPSLLNLVKEDSNHLWLCTEKGLVLYNEHRGIQKIYQMDNHENPLLTANFINTIFIDSRGNHWVFPWRSGIWQLDPKTGKFKKIYSGFIQQHGVPKELLIADAAEDQLGNLWFADLDEGLIHYDHNTGVFSKPLEKIFGSKFSLQNIQFEKPFVWLITGGKVCRIHTVTRQLEKWAIPDAFNKRTSGFSSDKSNHLWITTLNGLLCFDKISYTFKRFTNNDGLLNNKMDGTIFSLQDDRIIYASDNYITEFDPAELLQSAASSQVTITGISSQNKPIPLGRDKQGQKKVELNYTYDNFTFHWALPNYNNPLQNQYYCKLEGVDKDWQYVGNKGEAQYASLEPGKYVFKARAAAGNGAVSKTDDEVWIVIQPPFWKSWWFIALVLIAVSSLLYAIFRIRLQHALRMERLRSKISSDLHDDIGSTLSSISILSEMVLREKNKSPSEEMVAEIKDNSILLMEKMDDIVWSINPKNDSLENLLLRIKRFGGALFEAKDIDYNMDIQDNVKNIRLPMEYRQHIFLIMKEAINNLVKYAKATKASISASYSDDQLEVTILDNGDGFEMPDQASGNGILNMKNRAQQMNASLVIESRLGQGTKVFLKVKIKKNLAWELHTA